MTTAMDISNTIREQIGQRALFMLGAKHLVGGDLHFFDSTMSRPGLSFQIGRNDKQISHIRVFLMPDDTYTVEFLRVRGIMVPKLIHKSTMIYADTLLRTIRDVTGLNTNL